MMPSPPDRDRRQPRLVRAEEAARMLGITMSRLRQLCSARRIPFVKLAGRSVRFDPRRLDAWIHNQSVEPESEGVTAMD